MSLDCVIHSPKPHHLAQGLASGHRRVFQVSLLTYGASEANTKSTLVKLLQEKAGHCSPMRPCPGTSETDTGRMWSGQCSLLGEGTLRNGLWSRAGKDNQIVWKVPMLLLRGSGTAEEEARGAPERGGQRCPRGARHVSTLEHVVWRAAQHASEVLGPELPAKLAEPARSWEGNHSPICMSTSRNRTQRRNAERSREGLTGEHRLASCWQQSTASCF